MVVVQEVNFYLDCPQLYRPLLLQIHYSIRPNTINVKVIVGALVVVEFQSHLLLVFLLWLFIYFNISNFEKNLTLTIVSLIFVIRFSLRYA